MRANFRIGLVIGKIANSDLEPGYAHNSPEVILRFNFLAGLHLYDVACFDFLIHFFKVLPLTDNRLRARQLYAVLEF